MKQWFWQEGYGLINGRWLMVTCIWPFVLANCLYIWLYQRWCCFNYSQCVNTSVFIFCLAVEVMKCCICYFLSVCFAINLGLTISSLTAVLVGLAHRWIHKGLCLCPQDIPSAFPWDHELLFVHHHFRSGRQLLYSMLCIGWMVSFFCWKVFWYWCAKQLMRNCISSKQVNIVQSSFHNLCRFLIAYIKFTLEEKLRITFTWRVILEKYWCLGGYLFFDLQYLGF
jgi:hypothetical protein